MDKEMAGFIVKGFIQNYLSFFYKIETIHKLGIYS